MIKFTLKNEGMKKVKKTLSQMEDRLVEGRKFALLDIAGKVVKVLQQIAPEINEVKYAEDLEIGYIEGFDKEEDAVIIFHKTKMRNLKVGQNEQNTALIIVPKENAPKYIYTLKKYSPIPASMLPLQINDQDAVVISKFYSQKDLGYFRNKIIQNKREIEKDFIRDGLKIEITDGDKGQGTSVYDDLSYSILKLEFGYGEKKKAHWRPAITKVMKDIEKVKQNFVKYVITGDKNLFDIPVISDIKSSDIKKDNDFQEKIINMTNLK